MGRGGGGGGDNIDIPLHAARKGRAALFYTHSKPVRFIGSLKSTFQLKRNSILFNAHHATLFYLMHTRVVWCTTEEVGTGSQNHMTYGAWNANSSSIFASWQFLAGVFSRSGHFWPSSPGHLKDPDR